MRDLERKVISLQVKLDESERVRKAQLSTLSVLEFNLQAINAGYERKLSSRDEAANKKKRQILKRLRELEQEIIYEGKL